MRAACHLFDGNLMDVICATFQTLSNIFNGVAFNCPVKNQYLLSEKYRHNSNVRRIFFVLIQ